MTVISVNNISLSFGTNEILKGISFSLNENDKLGIVGVNGCGKSTLLSLILGDRDADSGNVYISKQNTIGVLRQNDAFLAVDKELGESGKNATALEVMYLTFGELIAQEKRLSELEAEMNENGADERTAAIYAELNERFISGGGLEFRGRCASTLLKMGFDESQMQLPYSALSGGQKTRLALSRELCREPDILLLDEPTNHLDIETLSWLESYLVAYKKCVIIISHDRYFLDRITNKTLIMENKTARLFEGSYTTAAKKHKEELEIQMRHYKNQQKEIARQEAYIEQQRAWNRERNIIAAESRLKLLEKMERVERPHDAPKSIKMKFNSSIESGSEVLRVNSLSFGYDTEKPLFSDFSLLVKKKDRLFFVGPNGCGKSTLIKLLMGTLKPSSGYIEAGTNVLVGYYDQENQNLTDRNTVLDELWNAYPSLTELAVRSTLAAFRFIGDDVFKTVSMLSGGERARLTLAKLLLSDMNLLILDEPTNHLDIASREALEEALLDFDGTIITVSHDRYFIDKLATRIIDIVPPTEGKCRDFAVTNVGEGYSELCRERERLALLGSGSASQPATKVFESTSGTGKEQYLAAKKNSAEQKKRERYIEKLKKEAEKLECELEEIEEIMQGEAATDYLRLAELDTRKNEIEERLLFIYEETDG